MKQNGRQIMVYAGEVNVLGGKVNTTKTHVKVKSLYRCNRHVTHLKARITFQIMEESYK
jgi:hypothetical protein